MQTVPNMTKILNPQKTYIIGLGGSGVKTAALIKFYLSRLFDLETTNFFRFRFIDCQEPALEIGKIDPGINDINENLQIGVDITDGLVKNNYIEKRLEPYFNNYHATDNRVTGTKDGAGVTRPYSLISLFAHVDEVYDKLAEDFAALSTAGTLQLSDDAEKEGYEIQRHDNDVPNILLFSSLTGGTGAGATLDIAALARQAASKSGNNPKLFAFLFLPDVFTESVNDPDIQDITPENIKQIQANGYAALKELEYYVNGNRFYCQYNHNITVDISNDPGEKLCDKMVLINRYNTSGNTPVHNPREAFKATAEGALHFITSQIAGDLPNRIIDNRMDGQMFPAIGVHLPLRDNGRRKQLYASMGIYTIDIPANEIRDWFTLKVIDNFFKDMRKTPLSREQIQPVVRNNTLSERDDILGKLGILHFSGGQSRLVSQKPLINKMLFKKLKGFVQKKIQYPVEPDSQNNVYRSVKEISKLKDWDCNGKGTLYNDSQKKIKEVLEKFHSDYIHDFKNPKEKKLIDLYTDSNLSLDEMIIEIINGNEEIGISDIETMLTMIIEELDEFEKQLLAFRNNNKLRYFSISEDVQQLTKTIEAESNWIQGFDLKQVDDFKEEWDLKKGEYNSKVNQIVGNIKKNLDVLVTDELVTMLQNLIEDVKEYTLSMLNEPDSLYQTIRTGEQQWRQNITNELDNVKDRMFKHQDNNYPLGTRYVPDENELESLFATGFKRLKPEKVAELLGSGNININQLFEDQAFDLDNLISVLKEDIYGIFEPFYRNLVFDDQTLFQFGEIQNSQRELMQKASPLLKHDESNLNTQSYRYCINPVDEANWRLSDYNNMTGNNPLKYTVFEYRDGIPGTVIFHIENWHDLYTDFIRKRKTDANPTGDDTIRPLHLFRDPIFFETYIPQRLVSMIKDKKTASNLAEAVFQAACKRNVIVAHNGSFKYHGVMAFGPTSRDDFVNEMSNNLSFLWDLYEAIYDVIKFTEDVPKSLRELNKEILEETLKGSKAE